MPTYDIACIASRRSSNNHMKQLVGRIAKTLNSRGGVIRRVEHYGMRPLAYPVVRNAQRHEIGRYFRLFVQASPISMRETLEQLRVDDEVIRFKPFKLKQADSIQEVNRLKFQHTPQVSEAHYDALKRTTNIDYYIARTLLMQGKITPEELQALGTHKVDLEPYFQTREERVAELIFQEKNDLSVQSRRANMLGPDDDSMVPDIDNDVVDNFDAGAFDYLDFSDDSEEVITPPSHDKD